ncbi:MAG: HAMP domain-containing sensor histidine kinase [Clostridiaceae bacterium]|nr:HAMP domain-containing sensor histidine kinase [Clostridiaceae bacterium]
MSLALSNLDLLYASVGEDMQETVRETRKNVLRMYRVIRKYEIGEALRSGKLIMDTGPHAVAGILERVRVYALAAAAEQGVEIKLEAPQGLVAACDAEVIEHVLWNLLENAMNATPTGGKVTFRAERVASGVRIAIEDTGIGFGDADTEQLIKAASGTSGLGISRELLRLQGSALTLSRREAGTEASFILPETEVNALHSPVPGVLAIHGVTEADIELSALKIIKSSGESSD